MCPRRSSPAVCYGFGPMAARRGVEDDLRRALSNRDPRRRDGWNPGREPATQAIRRQGGDRGRRPRRPPRLPAGVPVRAIRPCRPSQAGSLPPCPASAGRHVTHRGGRAHRHRSQQRPPHGWQRDALRRARGRDGRRPPPGGDRGADRPGMAGEDLHLLHARRRDAAARRPPGVRPRPAGGEHGRPARQVPGRPAGVLLPGRLVLQATRHPRASRHHLRHVARRRVHQGDLQPGAVRTAARQGHRSDDRVQHRSGRRRRRQADQLGRP